MKNWVERLARCGIPVKTAEEIVGFLMRNRRTLELIAYIRLTEEATQPERNGGKRRERIPESYVKPIWLYSANADAADSAADAGDEGQRRERSAGLPDGSEQLCVAAG